MLRFQHQQTSCQMITRFSFSRYATTWLNMQKSQQLSCFCCSSSSSMLVSSRRWCSTKDNEEAKSKFPKIDEKEETQAKEESLASGAATRSTTKNNNNNNNNDNNNSDTTNSKQSDDAAVADSTSVSQPPSSTSSSSSSPAIDNATNTDLSVDLEVEPMRWDVPVYSEEIVDEKGQYIVSRFPWKTGELAYKTPDAPAPHEARFGYQIVVVKKPQSYWSWYRRANFFSFTHIWYQLAFALGFCWLLTWVQLETNYLYHEMRRPGNLAADQLGKGDANRHQKKITVTAEERDEVLKAMQNAFLDGKDLTSKGSKDYRMKKIPRPKEFNAQDYLRN